MTENLNGWILYPGSSEEWNSEAEACSYFHPFQFWEWGEAQKLSGWKVDRLAWKEKGLTKALFQILIRKKGPFAFAYGARGPLTEERGYDLWKKMLLDLQNRYRQALSLKINPWRLFSEEEKKALRDLHFKKPSMRALYENTSVIDLIKPEDDLWMAMRKTFRHDIRRSQESGTLTRELLTKEELEAFISLHRKMNTAKAIERVSPDFFRNIWNTMIPARRATIRAAFHQGKMIAAVFLLLGKKKVVYSWGASDPEIHEDSGSKHLHWESMKWAKAQGFTSYDMGGIDAVQHAGVARFKEGFHGEPVTLDCEWEWNSNPVLWNALSLWGKFSRGLRKV